MRVLTCNVGSTSLRFAVLEQRRSGGFSALAQFHGPYERIADAFEAVRPAEPFNGIAHRIVHAGPYSLEAALPFDDALEAAVEAARPLAPDHNGPALAVFRRCRALYAAVKQIAVFDAHFHATIPERAYRYPLPASLAREHGIRRYGFHGLSHAYSVLDMLVRAPNVRRHISVHAGGGISVTAIEGGRAVDTTMGFTPFEGPVMSNRSGSVDPGIIFALHRAGYSVAQIEQLLTRESGLLALSGVSGDYPTVAQAAAGGDAACALALQTLHCRVAQEVARMAVSLGGVDALSFTGGVGENAPAFRQAVCALLPFLPAAQRRPAIAITSREDLMLARAFVAPASSSGP